MSAIMQTRRPVGGLVVLGRDGWVPADMRAQYDLWRPKAGASFAFVRLMRSMEAAGVLPDPDAVAEVLTSIWRAVVIESALALRIVRANGRVEGLGVVSRRVITTTGVGHIVDAYQNLVEVETMNYHGLGTGTTAEAAADTALVTELTTQYNPDNTRATGTQSEPAANQYRSTGTNTLDVGATIQEHGLMSQAATGGGVLFDRSLTGGQTLNAGDGLQSQYTATFSAGG